MRIQHNIAALNSYRQLAGNNSAVSKNLEKLSSGYRINRAGDDAAGLAISEKMRAQITGLEAAQKNANDGISLIQTAEGSLQEVHSMLNRMVSLATMSSNGTYEDTNRAQYQKEVDSLLEEIDRIAQSANFNGQKLLDGTLSTAAATYSVDVSALKGAAATDILDAGTTAAAATANATESASGTAGTVRLHKDATQNNKTSFEVDLSSLKLTTAANNNETAILQLTVGDGDVTLKLGKDFDTTEKIANGIAELLNGKTQTGNTNAFTGTATGCQANGNAMYDVTVEGSVLKFDMKNAAAITDADDFEGNLAVSATFTANTSGSTINNATGGPIALGTGNVKEGSLAGNGNLAAAMFTLTADDITNGSAIKLGNETYVFASDKETAEGLKHNASVKVVDITDIMKDETLDATGKLNAAADKLTQVATGNTTFDVTHTGTAGQISVQERASNTTGDMTTVDGVMKQLKKFAPDTLVIKTPAATGKALTLQVGDTSEDYQKISVSIDGTSAKGLGLENLDISTEEAAGNSINTIKNAIDKVSDIRAGLGALQNRLDHTLNNLGVTTENITAAESRIRDTDMAQEMMNYTKNNILVQAAQAMLAQANQVPQGVLQLLQ